MRAPTLLVRPTEGFPGMPASAYQELSDFGQPHTLIEVPGDHFNFLARSGDVTAREIHRWLSEVAPPEETTSAEPLDV